jgi:hypothetical protein
MKKLLYALTLIGAAILGVLFALSAIYFLKLWN